MTSFMQSLFFFLNLSCWEVKRGSAHRVLFSLFSLYFFASITFGEDLFNFKIIK